MSRKNSETITTYISTLQVNLSGNEDTFLPQSKQERISQHGQSHTGYLTSTTASAKQKNDVTSSYKQACAKGTFFQLVSSKPEGSKEATESGAFQRGKAYFEGLQSDERKSSSVHNEVVATEKDEEVSSFCSQQSSRQTSFSSSVVDFDQENECSISSERESSSSLLETTLSESSSFITKKTTKTSYSTESSIESHTRGKTSTSSADRYGETDWYMDILLRMQALDMKQQNLMVEYDFLNKIADDTKQDLRLAKDWEKYESDMNKVLEVY